MRAASAVLASALLLLVVAAARGEDAGAAAAAAATARQCEAARVTWHHLDPAVEVLRPAYLNATAAARRWLDSIAPGMDASALGRRGIAGKKKLAEMLDAYSILYKRGPVAGRAAALQKARWLLEQIPGNHGAA